MDPPPANPTDLQWFHYFQEENQPLLPWDEYDNQTMKVDDYLEMLNHDDELGFQDFDPLDDISLWDYNHDVVTDVNPIHHDSINYVTSEPNLSSPSACTEIQDDDLAPFLISCNIDDNISDHQDNNTTTDEGGQELGWWDDTFPLLISSIVDEDSTTSTGHLIINPVDHVAANSTGSAVAVDGGGRKRVGRRCVQALELEEIEKLFEMPIVMAAKELNVGLTVLKKRCRELNIKRWPHRKLKSIKSLIQNVKEMGLKEEMEMLEENKRMMEKAPEMQLTPRTKKLRQACFKFNYKKRRLLITNLESPHYPNFPFN